MLGVNTASADPIIGTASFGISQSSVDPVTRIQLNYEDVDNAQDVGSEPYVTLFDLTAANFQIGIPHILNSGLAFDFLASRLADGLNDRFTLLAQRGAGPTFSGGGNIESRLFHNDTVVPLYGVPPTANADLFGNVVTSFELVLNYVDADNVPGTLAAVEATYIVRGVPIAAPIPEPETYAMLLAGLGLLGVMTRRRNRKLDA